MHYYYLFSAKEYSLDGSRFVLESDGTEIDDDETLQCILEDKQILMILKFEEMWTPNNILPIPIENIEQTKPNNDITTENSQSIVNIPTSSQEISGESFYIALSSDVGQHLVEVPLTEFTDTINITSDEELMASGSATDELNTLVTKNNPICDSFQGFQIPWNRMSPEVLSQLNNKEKIGKLINSFCNVIVDELRRKTNFIPMNVYRNVAHMAATKYPESFVEKDGEGRVMSYTPISLVTTMRSRNNFLNYSSKKKINVMGIPLKKKTFKCTI